MENNQLLMIVLAFVLGCMCSQMMKHMCGQRLVEGGLFFNDSIPSGYPCTWDSDCASGACRDPTKDYNVRCIETGAIGDCCA